MRELVVPTAHCPTAPVMKMEDVPTSSRSGFALIFSEQITEPTTFDYIMTKRLGSPRADLIDVPEEASDQRPVALGIDLPSR